MGLFNLRTALIFAAGIAFYALVWPWLASMWASRSA